MAKIPSAGHVFEFTSFFQTSLSTFISVLDILFLLFGASCATFTFLEPPTDCHRHSATIFSNILLIS